MHLVYQLSLLMSTYIVNSYDCPSLLLSTTFNSTTKLKDLHHLLSPDQKNAQGGLARLDLLHTFGSIFLPSKQPR